MIKDKSNNKIDYMKDDLNGVRKLDNKIIGRTVNGVYYDKDPISGILNSST